MPRISATPALIDLFAGLGGIKLIAVSDVHDVRDTTVLITSHGGYVMYPPAATADEVEDVVLERLRRLDLSGC